ncbi:MAG: hypothetical protein KY463_08155 [Actinobacteria bacterium]|nr:hypothetical protein [Actinomycetota bacterium]
MRYVRIALTSLALMALGACGSDQEDPTGAGAVTQEEARSPAQTPSAILNGALTTMRQLGLSAGRDLDEIGEDDLQPSARGAQLLIDRGLVDEDRFCTADRIVVEAEATAEAQSRFASGWRAGARGDLDDMGRAIYEALATRCSER